MDNKRILLCLYNSSSFEQELNGHLYVVFNFLLVLNQCKRDGEGGVSDNNLFSFYDKKMATLQVINQ